MVDCLVLFLVACTLFSWLSLVNGGLTRYNSALLPEKGNILNYWIRISKPVFRKMLFPILLQTGFAAYLGSRQYKLLIKALQLPEPDLEIQ